MRRHASACPRLPFVPHPFPGEMLSSWLGRIAAEYRISMEHLARHLGLSVWRPVEIDHAATRDDIERTAAALSVAPTAIRDMVHRPLRSPVRRLRERYAPVQICAQCRAEHDRRTNEPVAIMAWFENWRIECQHCALPFSSSGRPNLLRSNPAREAPNWFARILPCARRGAAQLASFVRQPYRARVSPVAILRLLSMPLDLSAPTALMRPWAPVDDGAGGHHCIAELFVPGLRERLREDPLLPMVWTERQPVRLVTARTILFAAMTNFLANPKAAYARIVASLGWTGRSAVERWLLQLPDHEARILAPRGKGGASAGCVSQLQQM